MNVGWWILFTGMTSRVSKINPTQRIHFKQSRAGQNKPWKITDLPENIPKTSLSSITDDIGDGVIIVLAYFTVSLSDDGNAYDFQIS